MSFAVLCTVAQENWATGLLHSILSLDKTRSGETRGMINSLSQKSAWYFTSLCVLTHLIGIEIFNYYYLKYTAQCHSERISEISDSAFGKVTGKHTVACFWLTEANNQFFMPPCVCECDCVQYYDNSLLSLPLSLFPTV